MTTDQHFAFVRLLNTGNDLEQCALASAVLTEKGMDYSAMQKEAKKANDVTGTLTHILEGLPTDCSVCALKDVCEEVEGMKELHFGIGSKGTDHH